MIDPGEFAAALQADGVDFFTGVPDSLLKSFCAYVTDNSREHHVIAANEGGAVGLAAGHYLATGRPAVVYMQNSGQGNAVNPLVSLADPDVYSIPMILLVGWRGMPGIHDEPQHVKQGKITIPLFETLGIPTSILADVGEVAVSDHASAEVTAHRQGWRGQVSAAVRQAMREKRPVALIVRKGLFGEYELQSRKADLAELRREAAIEGILKALPADAVVVSTTGMISREVYEVRERLAAANYRPISASHATDFLTVGSMGHASQIALGIAMAQPKRMVVCLDGDGASLMQLGNLAIVGQSHASNLFHIVLNNSAHDSVGGQPTVGGDIALEEVARSLGYEVLQSPADQYGMTALTATQVEDAMRFVLQVATLGEAGMPEGRRCPSFMEIRVAKGARKDLGRPKEPPSANKALFMGALGVEA